MKKNETMPGLPAKDWQDVIEKVQEVLTQTGAAAAERARILDSTSTPAQSEEKLVAWKQGLERYEERIQGLQACLHQAEQKMDESEASMSEVEPKMNDWIEAVRAMRKKWQEQEPVAR
jgi:chromosome segregation ATPase